MDNSTKSRLAIDLDALEAQLKNVHHQQPTRRSRSGDPLSELARIVGQDDPYRALLGNERAPAEEEPAQPAGARRRRETDHFIAGQRAGPAQAHDGAANDDGQLDFSRVAPHQPSTDFEAALRSALADRRQPGAQAQAAGAGHAAQLPDNEAYAVEDAEYADDGADQDGGYAVDEEPEEPRSRRGLVAVAALLAVGAVGLGGFYFARGSSVRMPSGEPPVIMAEKQPTKVQAKGSEEAASPSKQIYETARQGGQEQDTKVVDNDEQPVDLNQALRRDGQTASLPPGQRGISMPQPPQASNLAGRQDEPRKVKTVAVRPDGSIVSEGQAAEPALSRGVAPALQSRPLISQGQSGEAAQGLSQTQLPPLRQGNSQVTPSAPSNGSSKQQARVGDGSEKSDNRAEGRANSPLAIAPVGQQPAEQAQAASKAQSQPQAEAKPQQRAAVQPPSQSPPRAQAQAQPQAQSQPARRVATAEQAGASRAAPAAIADGGFVVQLAAPGSEQEARETFASLQRKHASELGGRQPIIRQAQVSGRTIWRLRVGAASREDAIALCNKLQAAGGACFVAKN